MRQVVKQENGDGFTNYQLKYDYDEAGNRVRKRQYQYVGEEAQPEFNEDSSPDQGPGGGGYWSLIGDEYYVRDVSGKEIAVYHSSNLDHWNVWGTDNVGKINANGNKFFYIKDHLGSVRVVLNSDNQIVSAIDYDCWGYPLENRSYQSEEINYKFTGKQRDSETGGACPDMLLIGNYFGARYYDARIANWGSVDPLFEKHIGWNPYNYVLRNPMALIDPDGRQIYFSDNQNIRNEQIVKLQETVNPLNAIFINETQNDKGEYMLDVTSLNEVQRPNPRDGNFMRLMVVANSNEPIDYNFVDYKTYFDYKDPKFENLQETSFESMERDNPTDLVAGYTFVSGNLTNNEKPKYTSGSSHSKIYINNRYGSEEGGVSLAHEFYVHMFNCILGRPWAHDGDKNGELKKQVDVIENEARSNFKKHQN